MALQDPAELLQTAAVQVGTLALPLQLKIVT